MKTIVVPIDFSTYSENAVKVAFQIAKNLDITIHLIHISNDTDRETSSNLENVSKLGTSQGIRVETFIDAENRVHKGITTHAKEKNADLIIMGTHGLTRGESQFLGSNAQRVVRYSSCPVLSIKNSLQEFNLKKIVYPTDLYYLNDTMFDIVIEWANFFDAKIELVHINTLENFMDTTESLEKMEEFIKEHPNTITNMNIYNSRNIVNGIINFSEFIDADCIAMSTLGKSGLHRFLETSITENVVNFSQSPVLSLCSSEISSD